ncbi:hypothetical protein B0H13DRAFT_1862190 [Mycena leptocephala]|nr:hypothetical protein B0H13DRAFT_1862190 [Mycena leptocephala]
MSSAYNAKLSWFFLPIMLYPWDSITAFALRSRIPAQAKDKVGDDTQDRERVRRPGGSPKSWCCVLTQLSAPVKQNYLSPHTLVRINSCVKLVIYHVNPTWHCRIAKSLSKARLHQALDPRYSSSSLRYMPESTRSCQFPAHVQALKMNVFLQDCGPRFWDKLDSSLAAIRSQAKGDVGKITRLSTADIDAGITDLATSVARAAVGGAARGGRPIDHAEIHANWTAGYQPDMDACWTHRRMKLAPSLMLAGLQYPSTSGAHVASRPWPRVEPLVVYVRKTA